MADDTRRSPDHGVAGHEALQTEPPSNGVQQNAIKPETKQEEPVAKKPSKIKQMWTKIGLDLPTFLIMIKGSLPPVIALAMNQSPIVAAKYSTLGYLVAIMSILGFCIMPRGKFIQTMTLNIFGACFAAAFNLLALFCVTEARKHTAKPGTSPIAYNSSASAICAIFLIFQLYLVNVLRAAKPQFQFPAIIYSIFANVSMTYGVVFPNMTYAISFMERLLEAFLTGFAICTAVSFLVFPTSSRMVVFKEMTGYMMSLNGMLKAQTAYMHSLEDIDPVANRKRNEAAAAEAEKKGKKSKKPLPSPMETPEALVLKESFTKVLELHTKLHGDITPAKREFAWGKLESHDLTELWKLLRMVFVPVAGLTTSIELVQRRAADAELTYDGVTEDIEKSRKEKLEQLHFLMKTLRHPFASLTADIERAIQHVLITLELVKPPKKAKDEESTGGEPEPGTAGFTEAYAAKVKGFHQTQQKTLRKWCEENGINLPKDFFEDTFVRPETWDCLDEDRREKNQRSLFFTLYLEYLLWRSSDAVLDLVMYADKRKQEGALKRSKLIFPGSKTLYKWLWAVLGNEDHSNDAHFVGEMDAGASKALYLGADFDKRKDPEHLPPRNTGERIGNVIRKIPHFFRSDESAFGFRVVCATMSIAIICFLHDTQRFFLNQRILWAMIMVAISMTRTVGQSVFTFSLRVIGTLVAVIGAFVVWYIVDGRTPGVLVFLFVWLVLCFYFVLKTPKLIIVAILSMVTVVMIVGYELQVRVIGKPLSEKSGQPAYPIYLLAPYRLATVTGGLLVAFVWTVLPFPVSESSELRRDLGSTLYLLANLYSIVHETVIARVKQTDGDVKVKGSHAYNLERARTRVFGKLISIIQTLRTNAAFSAFQVQMGGRFPREEYLGIIECCSKIMQYTALIAYASLSFSAEEEQSQWSADFRRLIQSVNHTSHQVTSLLSLLSSSMANGQPLPPYIEMPQPFALSKKMQSIDPDLLSIRHIAEPSYGAFAVVNVASAAISYDLEKLTQHVKNLVGEIDFSFHAVSSSEESSLSDSFDGEKSGKSE